MILVLRNADSSLCLRQTVITVEKNFFCRTTAIYRRPPVSSVNNIFTLPFVLSVWIVLIFSSFTFTVTITFLTWALNKFKARKTRLSDALDTITMVLGAICQQGEPQKCIIGALLQRPLLYWATDQFLVKEAFR